MNMYGVGSLGSSSMNLYGVGSLGSSSMNALWSNCGTSSFDCVVDFMTNSASSMITLTSDFDVRLTTTSVPL